MRLGFFHNRTPAGERYLMEPDGTPASRSVERTRALWRILAEHVYHDLRVVGEQSPLNSQYDSDDFTVIEGDRQGIDPSLTEYLDDWPG
jgi:hypothetical protein